MAEKVIMLGNEAIARGAYEAGVKVSSAYPGTPSTEISEYLVQYKDDVYEEWAPNEKVATEVAIGASIGGARSFCAMKHVGLNVAADPLFTSTYTGVNGGLIIAAADDPGMHSSQNEQDSRHYAIAAKLPMVEPADSQECKDFVKAAYEISEKYDTRCSSAFPPAFPTPRVLWSFWSGKRCRSKNIKRTRPNMSWRRPMPKNAM